MKLLIYIFLAILILISGALSMRLFWYKNEIKDINEQLEFLLNNDTNIVLNENFSTAEIGKMIENMNEVVNKYRTLQLDAKRREKNIKNDFASLSHDIRTPLTAISGYFQLLLESKDEAEKEKYVKILNERISTIEAMLEEIFTYSKLQNDSFEIDVHKMNLSETVINSTLMFYETIKAKNIEPVISYPENTIFINGNEDAYKRIVCNIIKNALEHGVGYLKLELNTNGETAVFSCENDIDTVDNINIEKVFDRFYKADKSRGHTSSGLGLSIAKMLCENMNATISAQIVDNKFKITVESKKF